MSTYDTASYLLPPTSYLLPPTSYQVVGDRFTESLYDIHIGLGGSTILEAGDHALGGGALSKLLPAKAIMATKLRTVRETEEVDRLRGERVQEYESRSVGEYRRVGAYERTSVRA